MNQDIIITHKEDYIHVQCQGEYSLDKAKLCIDMILGACEGNDCPKAFVDLTKMETMFDEVEKVLIADHLRNKLLNTVEKLALLATQTQFDPSRFFEMAAANRGVHAKTFLDEYEALGWLKAG